LDDAGLEAALEWVAAEYEREFHGAAFVDTRIAGDMELTPEVEVALFRIAQEALTNSGKHAGATTVWIRLRFEDRTAVLTVEDNGRGFDPTSVPRPTRDGRLGMYGMRERAALFGGSLTIDASPGKGTLVRATLPLPESKPALEPEPVFTIERGEQ
jgi:signal transduction histidine kinase